MLIGEVIGTVVATQKSEGLNGLKLLIVEQMGPDASRTGNHIVAVDSVGAGQGDVVLYVIGSSARTTESTSERPVDALIMGIIDSLDVLNERKYEKWSSDGHQ